MAAEAVVVYAGTEAEAETLATMLHARGIAAISTPADKSDTTAIVEAVIRVPLNDAEDARELIADVQSGAASTS